MRSMSEMIPWRRNSAPATSNGGSEQGPFLSLQRQMNRMFDDFFQDLDRPLFRSGWSGGWPSLEVRDEEKEVRVVAEIPGLDEKDIDITLADGVLTLKGEKKQESGGNGYSERWHGRFARSVDLGSEVDPEQVKATFDKGVLTVTLAKRPEAQSSVKKIQISKQ